MFDIGWSELAVIAVVALVAIGPKELPRVLYQMGKWVRYARHLSGEFQRHVDHMMHEVELDELRKQQQEVARQFDIQRQIREVLDPTIERRFDSPLPPQVTPQVPPQAGGTTPPTDAGPALPPVPASSLASLAESDLPPPAPSPRPPDATAPSPLPAPSPGADKTG